MVAVIFIVLSVCWTTVHLQTVQQKASNPIESTIIHTTVGNDITSPVLVIEDITSTMLNVNDVTPSVISNDVTSTTVLDNNVTPAVPVNNDIVTTPIVSNDDTPAVVVTSDATLSMVVTNDVASPTSIKPGVTEISAVDSTPLKSTQVQLDMYTYEMTTENLIVNQTGGLVQESTTEHELISRRGTTSDLVTTVNSDDISNITVSQLVNHDDESVSSVSSVTVVIPHTTSTQTSIVETTINLSNDTTLYAKESSSMHTISSMVHNETFSGESITTTDMINNTSDSYYGENGRTTTPADVDLISNTSVEIESATGALVADLRSSTEPVSTAVYLNYSTDVTMVTEIYTNSSIAESYDYSETTAPYDNKTGDMFMPTTKSHIDNGSVYSDFENITKASTDEYDDDNVDLDAYNVTMYTTVGVDNNATEIQGVPIGAKTTPMTTKAVEAEPTIEDEITKPVGKPGKDDDLLITKATQRPTETTTMGQFATTWSPPLYVTIILKASPEELCTKTDLLQKDISAIMTAELADSDITKEQVNINTDCYREGTLKKKSTGGRVKRSKDDTDVEVYINDDKGYYSYPLTKQLMDLLADKGIEAFKDTTWHELVIDIKFHGSKDYGGLMAKSGKNSWKPHVGVLVAIVIGAIAAVIVLAFLILQLVVMKRRRRMKKMRHSYDNRYSIDTLQGLNLDSIQLTSIRMTENRWGYANPALIIDDKDYGSNPLNYAALCNFVKDATAMEEEFLMLPNYVARLADIPIGAEDKNRYANVIPVPESRVCLSTTEDRSSSAGYINANFVRGYLCAPHSYIATQAPLNNTTEDFWRMVYEQKAQSILMLTSLDERGSSRCEEYWPNTDGGDTCRKHGEFEVTLIKRDIRREWITSALRVKHCSNKSKQSLDVYHFWMTSWPSNGLPDPRTLIGFLLASRPYMERSIGPTIVHCSPGTGRTGVVLAADIQMMSYDDCKLVDVLSCVCGLRQDRAGLVQNQEQYKLIYKVVQEYAQALHNVSRNPSRTSSYNSIQTATNK